MDVTALVEPASTAAAQALFARARSRLAPSQRSAMDWWSGVRPFDAAVLRRLRDGECDLDSLRTYVAKLERTRSTNAAIDPRAAELSRLLQFAAERPCVVSAIIWQWLGAQHSELAAHVVQSVRERAGLPDMSRRHTSDVGVDVDAFADRQLEDVARWFEHVPPPEAKTLAEAITATEAQRDVADRIDIVDLATFMRQSARFFHVLSQRSLDPLGFSLAREAQLRVELPLDERLELAAWARDANHTICARGRIVVLRIAIDAPWPLALELIAADLGRGVCGGAGLLLRLSGDVTIRCASAQPLLLCLPGEPIEQLGARFERWLSRAYPAAVDVWRRWC
jgi:hypothetical protein